MPKIVEGIAYKIAAEYLSQLAKECGEDLKLSDEETIERNFGWVFFYNSADFLETGNFRTMLTGNAPFIVDRRSGEIHVTGTSKPTSDYIEEYAGNWES